MKYSHSMAGLLACALLPVARAEVIPLDEIVVTATRAPSAVGTLPLSVSVIKRSDIERSSATTVQDVLATQAGINISQSGGANASVDLRGFGMTASSNTLILLNGQRLNDIDSSAVNLSGIPLGSIERIEIVRGSGAVQYGGGATGGVINIITTPPGEGEHTGTVTLGMGSFARRVLDASLSVQGDAWSLGLTGGALNTDQDRANSALQQRNVEAHLRRHYADGFLDFSAASENQQNGLPGGRIINPALGIDQYHQDPYGTNPPNNFARNSTQRYGLSWQHSLNEQNDVALDLFSRRKTGHIESNGSPDDRRYSDMTVSPRLSTQYTLWGLAQKSVLGIDWLAADAMLRGFNNTDISQRQLGVYLDNNIALTPTTRITLGGRLQQLSDQVQVVGVGTLPGDDTLTAWQVGVRQQLTEPWAVYAKYGTSFRIPNADEVNAVGNVPLQPQTSRDSEVGLEWRRTHVSFTLSIYELLLHNEIAFNPINFTNQNLDPTRHRGVEISSRWLLNPRWTLTANATWQQVQYRAGQYAGNQIPVIPQSLYTLGLAWQPQEKTSLSMAWRYVGAQRLDNDQSNSSPNRLEAYNVLDVKWQQKLSAALTFALSVENALNILYASYGVRSLSSAAYTLYPEPRRAVNVSLSYAFH